MSISSKSAHYSKREANIFLNDFFFSLFLVYPKSYIIWLIRSFSTNSNLCSVKPMHTKLMKCNSYSYLFLAYFLDFENAPFSFMRGRFGWASFSRCSSAEYISSYMKESSGSSIRKSSSYLAQSMLTKSKNNKK